jgi:hypothetical protein
MALCSGKAIEDPAKAVELQAARTRTVMATIQIATFFIENLLRQYEIYSDCTPKVAGRIVKKRQNRIDLAKNVLSNQREA